MTIISQHVWNAIYVNDSGTKLKLSQFRGRFLMEHIDRKCSWKSKLQIGTICSVGNLSRNRDIIKKLKPIFKVTSTSSPKRTFTLSAVAWSRTSIRRATFTTSYTWQMIWRRISTLRYAPFLTFLKHFNKL